MKLLPAAVSVLVLLSIPSAATAETKLERVVIVQRHGVRPPTKAAGDLAKYSEAPWPDWSVPPGNLTAHGAEAMTLMGDALRRTYAASGLFENEACPAGVFVWSDSADQRTRASGDAILKGFGCTAPSQHLADGREDPLFDAVAANICSADTVRAKAAAQRRLDEILIANRAAYDSGRKRLQAVLTPAGCGKPAQRACTVGDGINVITDKSGEVRLEGPLGVASSLSENLLLEYSEGMPLHDVGWGEGAGALATVLPLHNLYADVMRRNVPLAAARSSTMARQIIDLLSGAPSTFRGAAPVPKGIKLVVFVGHDGNLSNLSGLLDAPWSLPGQPDATAPGTALAFELWRASDGTRTVKTRILYQTPDDVRTLATAHTPRSQPVSLPNCADGTCSLAAFTRTMEKHIAADCLKR